MKKKNLIVSFSPSLPHFPNTEKNEKFSFFQILVRVQRQVRKVEIEWKKAVKDLINFK